MFQIGLKKIFGIEKVKDNVHSTYVISDLEEEEIVKTFYAIKFQKANQKEFRVEKVIKEKVIIYM